jgi:voltage-gated potassium channel
VRNRRDELLASFIVIVIVVVLAGNVMYLLEHHAQADRFSSVPAAMWWAVVTVTTIGYGDVVPITTLGRIVGSGMALMGIVMLALPVGVLGAGFIEEIERRRRLAAAVAPDPPGATPSHGGDGMCPRCGYVIERR